MCSIIGLLLSIVRIAVTPNFTIQKALRRAMYLIYFLEDNLLRKQDKIIKFDFFLSFFAAKKKHGSLSHVSFYAETLYLLFYKIYCTDEKHLFTFTNLF